MKALLGEMKNSAYLKINLVWPSHLLLVLFSSEIDRRNHTRYQREPWGRALNE
jgi:hypothetical protein